MFKSMNDIDVKGKRVLVRVDFNVPMKDGKITSDERMVRALPTLKTLSDRGARVIILSHLGRPDGKIDMKYTQKPVAEHLSVLLGKPVKFCNEFIGEIAENASKTLQDGEFLMLENVRFDAREEKNDKEFVNALAKVGDIYVSDAFSAAHRAHASTEGLAHVLPSAAGLLMGAELSALESALGNPKRPVMAIVGGAKISTKLSVLHHLITKVDYLLVGGGMANTFLHAMGVNVGKSLCEKDMAGECLEIIAAAKSRGCAMVLPVDATVAKEFKENAPSNNFDNSSIPDDGMILDVGSKSIENFVNIIKDVKTVLWNGPIGAFEISPFDNGTVLLAKEVARLTKETGLISVAGGGDTVSALEKAGVLDKFSYVSTAGGAFLEWMEGKSLPGVEVLKK